jgi:hypothetical protein
MMLSYQKFNELRRIKSLTLWIQAIFNLKVMRLIKQGSL